MPEAEPQKTLHFGLPGQFDQTRCAKNVRSACARAVRRAAAVRRGLPAVMRSGCFARRTKVLLLLREIFGPLAVALAEAPAALEGTDRAIPDKYLRPAVSLGSRRQVCSSPADRPSSLAGNRMVSV